MSDNSGEGLKGGEVVPVDGDKEVVVGRVENSVANKLEEVPIQPEDKGSSRFGRVIKGVLEFPKRISEALGKVSLPTSEAYDPYEQVFKDYEGNVDKKKKDE